MFILVFVSSILLGQMPMVYRYDSATGLWKRVDEDESKIIVQMPSLDAFSNVGGSFPIVGSIILRPPTESQFSSQFLTIKAPANNTKWYYYSVYPFDNTQRNYEIIAGQNEIIGRTTIRGQNGTLKVSFNLFDGWLASSSHMKVLTEEPTNLTNVDLAPGQFPYKQSYSPATNQGSYEAALFSLQATKTLYVLLHLEVMEGTRKETAWSGNEETNQMCLEVSGGKVNWYVKKPGDYVAKFLNATIVKSGHPVVITFSNFDHLSLEGGGEEKLPVSYSFTDELEGLQTWISAPELNNVSCTLQNGQILNLLHRVQISNQQAGTYRNTATITFTLQVVENYIEKR
ncbi:hypothetical protein [Pseudothermotoga sp.]|uniref:hypothetical protein n=1 Tax=Pseudothermotoga sp. TaxID=2033661 RepID=UPI0031F5F460